MKLILIEDEKKEQDKFKWLFRKKIKINLKN